MARPEDTDWREAIESAINSLKKDDLSEWELHLITRRVDATIADMQKRLDRWEPKLPTQSALGISAQQFTDRT